MKFCLAYGKICYLCGNQNHFKSKCMSQRQQVYETKHDKAHNDNISTDNDDNVYLNVVHNELSDTLSALLEVNEYKVRF